MLDEISNLANWDRTLAAYVRHQPPIYSEHVVVKRNPGRPVIPLAFYLDGVRFGVRQTTLGVWLVNLVTNRRQLVCNLRRVCCADVAALDGIPCGPSLRSFIGASVLGLRGGTRFADLT